MPVNKSARFRFEIIDECLRNTRKKWSKADLLGYVNRRLELQYGDGNVISLSQLRYDLEGMQSECSAPIEMYRVGKNYYYRYEDSSFSIKNIPVNEDEIARLHTAVQLLRQIKGFRIADEVSEIVKRLESRYNFSASEQKDLILLESASGDSGNEDMEDIYEAIISKHVLNICYLPPLAKTAEVYNVHPYQLREFNNVWYLVGYCHEKQRIDTYELGRMEEIKISKLPYAPDLSCYAEAYFQDVVGISKPNERLQSVELLFTQAKAAHIIRYPLHSSQKITKEYPAGEVQVELKLIINQELTSMLLSYGSHVKVLSPAPLANAIAEEATKLLASYSNANETFARYQAL